MKIDSIKLKQVLRSFFPRNIWKVFSHSKRKYLELVLSVKILSTPPFYCNPASKTEIHTLVCSKDIYSYIISLKSFLRFYNDVSIIAHDDQSLKERHKRLLAKHIQGIRIIDKRIADEKMMELLNEYPFSRSFRQKHLIAIQLFDYAMMSNPDTTGIISFDSDTLFLQKPLCLIEWIDGNNREGNKKIMYLYEENPKKQKEVALKTGFDFQPHVCVGLLAYNKDIIDLELIEQVVSRIVEADQFDWCTSQNVLSIIMKSKSNGYPVTHFESEAYQSQLNGLEKNAILRHYHGSFFGVNTTRANDVKKVITSIASKKLNRKTP